MRFSIGCFIKFFFEDTGKNIDCKVCNAIVVDNQISIVGTGSNDLRFSGFNTRFLRIRH